MGRLHTIKGLNGGIGLSLLRGSTLQCWGSVISTEGDHVWSLDREIDLSSLLGCGTSLLYDDRFKQKILCACEDRDILVIRMNDGVFQLDIRNYKCKKIYDYLDNWIHPLYILLP